MVSKKQIQAQNSAGTWRPEGPIKNRAPTYGALRSCLSWSNFRRNCRLGRTGTDERK